LGVCGFCIHVAESSSAGLQACLSQRDVGYQRQVVEATSAAAL